MKDLQNTVRDILGQPQWRIEAIAGSRAAFFATDGDRRLFVKLGASAGLLRRLNELDVVPRVIATGQMAGGEIVIQEFVDGIHPDPRWIDQNVVRVCSLIGRYHSSSSLGDGVEILQAADVLRLAQNRLDRLSLSVRHPLGQRLALVLDNLARSAAKLERADMRLTHGDPNTTNLILDPAGRLYLVDWDEARVTDAVRDVGQVLWWYVRMADWAAGLEAAGIPATALTRNRVFWWAAAESVDVSLQHLENGNARGAADFANDAVAASRNELNPRAWYRSS